jgi:membrane dipeptidase
VSEVTGGPGRLAPQTFIWDTHAGFGPSFDDLSELEPWFTAGIGHVSVNVGYDVVPWTDTFRVLGSYRSWIDHASDRFLLVEGFDDIERARTSGRVSVSFDLEGLVALAGDIRLIDVYRALGVRQMGFAYNLNNLFAGGCHDHDSGLTPLGRQAVAEMNRLGIVVDCSHVGRRSSLEIMSASEAPVVFSHSNCAAIHDHGRNITDEQIRACADTGGVVGINGLSLFLGPGDPVDTLVRHIEHVAALVGPEHVGLGLDSVVTLLPLEEALKHNPRWWPAEEGYGGPIEFVQPRGVDALARRIEEVGIRGDHLLGIMGGNFLRVARTVWREDRAPTHPSR